MQDIYLMAHRANTIAALDSALDAGFNAIEFDVKLSRNGQYYAWHGEWGAGWTVLADYLDRLATRLLADPQRRVSLLIVDLKYTKGAGLYNEEIRSIQQELRNRVLTPVNTAEGASPQNGLFVLYTTTLSDDYAQRLLNALGPDGFLPHEGVNLDAGFHPFNLRQHRRRAEAFVRNALLWRNRNGVNNLMLSAGYTAGLPLRNRGWEAVLRAANQHRDTHVFGTYAWTFMRARGGVNTLLAHRLDGVMGNANRRFGQVPGALADHGLDDHRLVTRRDRPPFKSLRN